MMIHVWRRIPGTGEKDGLFRCTRCLARRMPVPKEERKDGFDRHLFLGFNAQEWTRVIPVCERAEARRATIEAQDKFVRKVAASGTVSLAAWRFYMKNNRFPHEGELSAEAATSGEGALPLLSKPPVVSTPASSGGAS